MRSILMTLIGLCFIGMCIPAQASWTSDNGNGTFSNPLFYEDFPDPSIIRVNEDFYMTSTTNHGMPGIPIFHSKDLINWTFISYAFDRLELGPKFNLDGGEVYGQSVWAPSLRFHNGTFYIFSNINGTGTQVFHAKDPKGPWTHTQLKTTLYDLSVLFDDNGKIYVVHSYDEVKVSELNKEITDVIPGTERVIIPRGSGMGEGLHIYKINGWYYIISAIPGAHTPMKCARSKNIDGPYEIMTNSEKENLGIGLAYSQSTDENGKISITKADVNHRGGLTLHQGGIIDTPTGEWWGYSMMDHNAIGRLTCISPLTWKDGWPYFGLPGNLTRTPRVWIKPNTGTTHKPKPLYKRSDKFNNNTLQPIWQWNHNPVNDMWSLTECKGYLRLHSMPSKDLWWAKNSLQQKAAGPESTATVLLETKGMETGDVAGVAVFGYPYGQLGVARTNNGLEIQYFDQFDRNTIKVPVKAKKFWLRVNANFDVDKANFSYSTDGKNFIKIGNELTMAFQMISFQGIRYTIFNYNTENKNGGYVDIDEYQLDEPRDKGLTKPIPYGKDITFTSLGNGKNIGVINSKVCAVDKATSFKVIDQGLGRVALLAPNGEYVSVQDKGNVGEVITKKCKPGDSETFQWVDMQRDDLMLLSLSTHRNLWLPEDNDLAAADKQTPRPDRLDGSVFRWTD